MMKKMFLSFLFTLCIVVTVVPITVAAEDPIVPTVPRNKTICANRVPIIIVAGTTPDFTNILYDKNNNGIIEDTEYFQIDSEPTSAGYDLSGYTILGGAQSGTITNDSMITINGGKVGDVFGGNYSDNLTGNVTIIMNGGSVARILPCGYWGSVGGSGKTVSVSIHGGTVRGGADQSINLKARNDASISSLLIDGGTINGRIIVKSSGGSFVIKGGNIPASIDTGTPAPTDGTSPVYKTTIMLKDGDTAKTNTAVLSLTTDADYTYGMTDVTTDTNGQLFIYLPVGMTATEAAVEGESSPCTVKTIGSWGGLASFKPAIYNTKTICANGTALIVDGADDTHTTVYIDANRNGVRDAGDQSLFAAGVENAPADNSDLSTYVIYGGADIGTITDDSMITINGGKVDDIFGGNRSYNMDSGTAIVMNGGNVKRILACGSNAVGANGKTVSVSIHGGTVRGGLDLSSRNNASVTSLFIDGGTINGSIAVKSSGGSFVIKGGNIPASFDTGTPVPTDGTSPVYKTTITIKDGNTVKANTSVLSLTTDSVGYTYGMTDVKTDANGQLFIYLPVGITATEAAVEGESSPCTVKTIGSWGGLASLMPAIYNTKTICANGTALVVDGTDDTHTTVYIDANRNGVRDAGDQSLFAAGVENAPADNSDLSTYVIYGGADIGTITDDSMITINGGKVDDIFGGNRSYNMDSGTAIVMNGGNVKRILACGYGYVGMGSGKTVSVSVHGGIVPGGVDLSSRNNASTTSLFIDGGMINGSIAVKSSGGSFVIKGGSIPASFAAPAPTDGTSRIYKSTIVLKDGDAAKTNTAVLSLTTDAGYTYGMTDVKTDANGNLYVYLAAGKTVTGATVSQNNYLGNVTTTAADTASGDLTSVAPIGTKLYANGMPIQIVAGTTADYANILYDKNNDGTIGETEYLKIGTVDPTAAGYDLSGYTIFGGKSSGDINGNISVTMTGGKIRYLCGGNWDDNSSPCTITGDISVIVRGGTITGNVQGGGNAIVLGNITVNIDGGTINGGAIAGSNGTVTGNVSINITGGNIGSLYPCGPDSDGTVKNGTASIHISGGTVTGNGGRAIYSMGTYENTAKSLIITGGSVKGSFDSAFVATPTNGGDTPVDVYKTTLSFMLNNGDLLKNIPVPGLTMSSGTYGMNDVTTDTNGNLYVYLPAGSTVTGATAGDESYTNSEGITALANDTANGVLTRIVSLWTDGLSYNAGATFGGGTGTQAAPYLLTSIEDLAQLALNVNKGTTYSGKYFRLTTDLDLAGKYWMSIGYGTSTVIAFRGQFDGGNHIIKNMKQLRSAYSGSTYFLGLFGWVYSGGSVMNLGVTNASINIDVWDGHDVGLLMGYADNGVTVQNCFAEGNITASVTVRSIGGLIGQNYAGGKIDHCFFRGSINAAGGTCVGGLLAYLRGATPTNCYVAASITSTATNKYAVASSANDCYYDSTLNTTVTGGQGTAKTTAEMKTADIVTALGNAWAYTTGEYPQLKSFVVIHPAQLTITAMQIMPSGSDSTLLVTFTADAFDAAMFTEWVAAFRTKISVCYSTTLHGTFESRLSDVNVLDNRDGTGTLSGLLPPNTPCAFFRIVVE